MFLAVSTRDCRVFDPDVIQDPTVYRFYEAIMHNGEVIHTHTAEVRVLLIVRIDGWIGCD